MMQSWRFAGLVFVIQVVLLIRRKVPDRKIRPTHSSQRGFQMSCYRSWGLGTKSLSTGFHCRAVPFGGNKVEQIFLRNIIFHVRCC